MIVLHSFWCLKIATSATDIDSPASQNISRDRGPWLAIQPSMR